MGRPRQAPAPSAYLAVTVDAGPRRGLRFRRRAIQGGPWLSSRGRSGTRVHTPHARARRQRNAADGRAVQSPDLVWRPRSLSPAASSQPSRGAAAQPGVGQWQRAAARRGQQRRPPRRSTPPRRRPRPALCAQLRLGLHARPPTLSWRRSRCNYYPGTSLASNNNTRGRPRSSPAGGGARKREGNKLALLSTSRANIGTQLSKTDPGCPPPRRLLFVTASTVPG